ncbi:hypothetical protein CBLAS_0817 [Campylobacter blaseri]|uniref:Transformation system protein n=1 Tax=Campylobacter blaseri TaxID=2042961 RepID=A0A2P8R2H9_9BACT|nr:CDC27 family protein [Campylobacter blaseri]PSM52703.1 hypothetical protein CQ405_02945 [Campylobacter blaseri]PSM54351.1 hypothetical protein CRN67_02945 [Campylobacter blaseri]QKF86004.1 hypothetical protein CBLAS_0817 [Campylobacter blaseri]
MLEHFEILELEEKWNRYNSNRKKKNKFFNTTSRMQNLLFDKTVLFLLILISGAIGAIFWVVFSNNGQVSYQEKMEHSTKVQEMILDEKNDTILDESNITSHNNIDNKDNTNTFLKINHIGIDSSVDSGGFILNNQYEDKSNINNFNLIPKDEIIDFGNPPLPPKTSSLSTRNTVSNTKLAKDRVIIKTTKLKEDKKSLEDKFYATNNITYSLMLSEQAYNNKNYNEAIKWALISNEINKDDARSWILFAKSKYKQSLKKDALIALEAFNRRVPNKEVQALIKRIENGDL